MATKLPATRVLDALPDPLSFDALITAQEPVIVKGMVRDWPLVRAGLESPAAAIAYLLERYNGQPITGYTGDPVIAGRYHYDATATAMNFNAERVGLDAYLARIAGHLDDAAAPSLYIGSTDIDSVLPGLRADNDLIATDPALAAHRPLASIWIGNRTTAAAHWDMSNNIACCIAGRRRFTLFPPEQVENLYPGPLDPTPGGQVVTMVDLANPDFERYPRFEQALAAAQVAELEPGDVLVYPALWWHQVDALDRFNILINYWWQTSPDFVDSPMTTLLHALLSLRGRTDHEKRGWRALFDFYAFGPTENAAAHLPEAAQGPLAPIDPMIARRLRAQVMQKLNR